jgi:asparagine synthase (glutamine-hydrolysing)
MCGIAGIVTFGGREENSTSYLIRDMCSALRHRGPDDEAYYSYGNTHLGMTRLAILDLRKGLYPIKNEIGNLHLFYNGEIYNFQELASELVSKGHEFASATDAEVVVHGYEEWGPDCFRRLNGMWAFALWDAKEQKLILGRDHFGIKPLYYHVNDDLLAFASEIRPLLLLPTRTKPREKAIYDYLVFGLVDHTEDTFFEGIRRVMPGHYATLARDGSFTTTRYWEMPEISEETSGETAREASDQVRKLFVDAVRIRLISDVPVGSCLSGGLDSSAIVSVVAMLEEKAKESIGKRLQAFSAWYPDDPVDESAFARIAAKAGGAELNVVYPSASGLWHDMPELVRAQEEPFGGTSIYAQWKVMQEAKARGITVLLDGQGGDEVFAGYIEYFKFYIVDLLRKGKVIEAIRESLLSLDLTYRFIPLLFTRRSMFKRIIGRYLNPDFALKFNQTQGQARGDPRSSLAKMLWDDTTRLTLPSLLRYEDKNSMHFSIETRLPFLDPRLVEYLASLPEDFKIRYGWTKRVLREAMHGILPNEIATRRSKIAFQTPQQKWFLYEIADGIGELLSSQMKCSKYVNQASVLDLFMTALKKKKISRWDSELIWRGVNLEFWLREFFP